MKQKIRSINLCFLPDQSLAVDSPMEKLSYSSSNYLFLLCKVGQCYQIHLPPKAPMCLN